MGDSSSADLTYKPSSSTLSDSTAMGTASDMAQKLLHKTTKAVSKANANTSTTKKMLFGFLIFVICLALAVAIPGGYCICRGWHQGFNPFTIQTIKKPKLRVPATGADSMYIASVPNSDPQESTYADWYPDECENHECFTGTLTFHTTTNSIVSSRPHKGELIRVDIASKIEGAAVFKVSPEMNGFSKPANHMMTGNFLLTLTTIKNRPVNIPYILKQNIDMNKAWNV